MYSFPLQQSNKKTSRKYWGLWLPVPTFLAIINSIFWIWLISRTVGLLEPPRTDARENAIIEQF